MTDAKPNKPQTSRLLFQLSIAEVTDADPITDENGITDTPVGFAEVATNITNADEAMTVLFALHQAAAELLGGLAENRGVPMEHLGHALHRLTEINAPAIAAVQYRYAEHEQFYRHRN